MAGVCLRRVAVAAVFLVLLGVSYRGWGVSRIEGRIVDDRTGRPVAATLFLTDEKGNPLEVEGEHAHVEYLGKRRCYVDGRFVINARPERLVVELRRGLETLPLTAEVDVAAQGGKPLTFRLERWIDMREEGYLSGDTHVHFLTEADSHLQMRAEDLDVLNLLVSDFTFDREKFSGELSAVSTPGHAVYVGQEARDWQQGHVLLLGIREIIEPFEPYGGREQPNLLMSRFLKAARKQGGTSTWAHFSNLPGSESPVAFALGLVDAIDLITYDDPTQLPAHWGPWEQSGMSQAEFPVVRSLDLYYFYLNAGFRTPIAAGTDKMGENIPVGSNRLYARPVGEADYDGWLAGLKAGNGFVTNGPMLTFEVDGKSSGDVVEFGGSRQATARASARSVLPFRGVEIVVNGKPVALEEVAGRGQPGPDGLYRAEVETELELEESSWVAARVAEHPARRGPILPRGLTVFAHTNPVYFLRNGEKVHEAASVRYLQTYLRATRHWLTSQARFRSEEEKIRALSMVDEAGRVLEELGE